MYKIILKNGKMIMGRVEEPVKQMMSPRLLDIKQSKQTSKNVKTVDVEFLPLFGDGDNLDYSKFTDFLEYEVTAKSVIEGYVNSTCGLVLSEGGAANVARIR